MNEGRTGSRSGAVQIAQRPGRFDHGMIAVGPALRQRWQVVLGERGHLGAAHLKGTVS